MALQTFNHAMIISMATTETDNRTGKLTIFHLTA
jgi:hypothetical protein